MFDKFLKPFLRFGGLPKVGRFAKASVSFKNSLRLVCAYQKGISQCLNIPSGFGSRRFERNLMIPFFRRASSSPEMIRPARWPS
eukprot:1629349-Amphidinium_carterae.1